MSSEIRDQATSIRKGEELALGPLQAYLNDKLPEPGGKLEIQQFPSGFSNLTYLLRFGKQEWVLRRPPFGANIKNAHDMGREHHVLSNLIAVYPKVPRPLLYCEDESVIGAPFYVMQRVQGVILRKQPPKGLDLSPELMKRLSESFVDNLVELHRVDFAAAGLSELGRPEGYIARQVTGWTRRYRNAQTDEIAEIDQVMAWLADNMPAEMSAALIHNDYKYDNVVLDPADSTRIVAVLDWEMATLGDPLMDLATTLSYWAEKDEPAPLVFGPTALPGNMNRMQLVDRYQERSGLEVANPVFYFVFGLFKLAVIVQQIYARYQKGHTRDERFANLIHGVRACATLAGTAVDKDRIYELI